MFLFSADIHLFIVALAKPDYDAAKGVTATAPSDAAERRGRAATETASLLLGSAEVLSAKAADSHTKDKLKLRGVVPPAFTIAAGREVRNALTTWHDYVRAQQRAANRTQNIAMHKRGCGFR